VSIVYQATMRIPDWDRFTAAIEWSRERHRGFDGALWQEVWRDRSDALRVSIVEAWESIDSLKDALRAFADDQPELFDRMGVEPSSIDVRLWDTGISRGEMRL